MDVISLHQANFEQAQHFNNHPICGGHKKSKMKTMIMKKSSKSCSICLEKFCEDELIKKT